MAKRESWINNKKKNYENTVKSIVTGVISPIIKNNSKVETEIILNWATILGKNFFSKIDFKKISPTTRKSKIYNLYVSVRKRDSLEISHSKDLLIEKINSFLGYPAIKEIIISNDKKAGGKRKLDLLSPANNKKKANQYIHYSDDEGLAEIFRNMERNLGEKDDKNI